MGETQRVFLGAANRRNSVLRKILDRLHQVHHDLRLFSIAQHGTYHIVQVRDRILGALIALLAARRAGAQFCYWMSFPLPDARMLRAQDASTGLSILSRAWYFGRGAVEKWLLFKVILPRADHVFVQSDRMKQDVAALGLRPDILTAIPMGVNLDILETTASIPEEHQFPEQKVLLYLGTLVRERRIEFLLDVLKRVREHDPRAILLLVGDGPGADVHFLRQEAERLGVADQVVFTGFVQRNLAWAYIRRSDICLSPFRPSRVLDSTSPTKVVEYLAWNRPVVANVHPDQSLVLHESGAGFAVEYDPATFADAILKLLREPEMAEAMARRGRDYVMKHRSYSVLTETLVRKYSEIVTASHLSAG